VVPEAQTGKGVAIKPRNPEEKRKKKRGMAGSWVTGEGG